MNSSIRIFTFILTLVFFVSFLVLPASAAGSESSDNFNSINVLDYCSPNGSGQYTLNFNSGDKASFYFPGMYY